MRSKRETQLRALAAELGSLVGDSTCENSIVPGNGYDEAILVGSGDSYLRLARVLVEIVSHAEDRALWPDTDMGEETIEGTVVVGTNRIKDVFSDNSPVWLMCAYVARDKKAAEEVARKLSEHTSNGAAGDIRDPR